jgi:uncharacterized protein
MAKKLFYANKSSIQGQGCFAATNIKKGQRICIMKGDPITVKEVIRRYDSGKERYDDPLQVAETTYLDLDHPYPIFNHSCNPNAAIVKKNSLVAIKDIKKDEEITYDYSLVEWTDDSFGAYKRWGMNCRCGSRNCRKVIKHFPLLPKNIQRDRIKRKVVQDFILRKYKKTLLKS